MLCYSSRAGSCAASRHPPPPAHTPPSLKLWPPGRALLLPFLLVPLTLLGPAAPPSYPPPTWATSHAADFRILWRGPSASSSLVPPAHSFSSLPVPYILFRTQHPFPSALMLSWSALFTPHGRRTASALLTPKSIFPAPTLESPLGSKGASPKSIHSSPSYQALVSLSWALYCILKTVTTVGILNTNLRTCYLLKMFQWLPVFPLVKI